MRERGQRLVTRPERRRLDPSALNMRRRLDSRARRDEPWTWDREWKPIRWSGRRAVDRGSPEPKAPFAGLVLIAMTVAGLVWIVASGAWGLTLHTLGGFAALWAVYARAAVSGDRVAYEHFPFLVGEPMRLRFGVDRRSRGFQELTLAVRCLQERPSGSYALRGYQSDVLHEDIRDLHRLGLLPEAGSDVQVEFELPSHAPGTDLTAERAVFWELEVSGKTFAGRFYRRQLLPVYAPRPS